MLLSWLLRCYAETPFDFGVEKSPLYKPHILAENVGFV